MHHLGILAETGAAIGPYDGHSRQHRRFPILDRAAGSVHQAITIAELDPGGSVETHMHAGEEGLYVLVGELQLMIAGREEHLAAADVVFVETGVPHAFANSSSATARWLELSAPQAGSGLEDPVFLKGEAAGADAELPYRRGRFDESKLPSPSDTIGLAGFGAANVGGAALQMLIDRDFGASQFNLFVVEYAPGGFITEHDHPFEEAFFFLSGEIEAVLDGETHRLPPGGYCWSGAGSMHTFRNPSEGPTRWIETQVPQPPARHQARFRNDWERLLRESGGGR